jgi:hypothetical protein
MSCTCFPHSYQAFSAVQAQSLDIFSSMQSTKIWAHIGKVSSFILSRFLQWAHYYRFGQEISSPNKIAFKTKLALIGLKKNNVHANSLAPGIQAIGAPKLRLEKPNLCNNPKLQVCALPQLLECVGLHSVIFILHHGTVHSSYRLLCILRTVERSSLLQNPLRNNKLLSSFSRIGLYGRSAKGETLPIW